MIFLFILRSIQLGNVAEFCVVVMPMDFIKIKVYSKLSIEFADRNIESCLQANESLF